MDFNIFDISDCVRISNSQRNPISGSERFEPEASFQKYCRCRNIDSITQICNCVYLTILKFKEGKNVIKNDLAYLGTFDLTASDL